MRLKALSGALRRPDVRAHTHVYVLSTRARNRLLFAYTADGLGAEKLILSAEIKSCYCARAAVLAKTENEKRAFLSRCAMHAYTTGWSPVCERIATAGYRFLSKRWWRKIRCDIYARIYASVRTVKSDMAAVDYAMEIVCKMFGNL